MALENTLRPTDPGVIPLRVESGYRTDVGPFRSSNEDNVIVVRPTNVSMELRKGVLAVVADGMGGHQGGEVASAIAVQTVSDAYYRSDLEPGEAMLNAFAVANHEIFQAARDSGNLTGMGTTCTAVAVVKGLAYCCHVGDSRAYLIRDGEIYCMTEDHSATMQMVRQGLITMAEARRHEERNVILRALGTHPKVDIAVWESPFPLRSGDRFLLCSDGLYETLEDAELNALIAGTPAQDSCDRLIETGISRNCSDNLSVAILELTGGHSENQPRVEHP